MNLSNFSNSGLDLGKDHSLTYLYGISDFFHIMFEDKDILDLTLEANAFSASEVYSHFLQLTTSISISQVQEAVGVSTKLLLINSKDAIGSLGNQFSVPQAIQSARVLANRPFLPTQYLDSDVDFSVSQTDSASSVITFAKPLSSYSFSSRALVDGSTQYAVWMADAVIDESLVYKAFGSLIGVSNENASNNYANFIYGLYFLYTQGPTLSDLKRGLNLILGVPLARNNEVVIDVRFYSESGQYVVITDQNQYVLPYGLAPTVVIEDQLVVGEELAQWVEVKDYENDGDWWINLRIPEHIIPVSPAGQPNRYATAGSHFDYAMRTFLKNHTFLVNVKVDSFQNVQQFTQIADILNKAKPSYTQTIYVWTLASQEELIDLVDDTISLSLNFVTCDHVFPDFSLMTRDNPSHDPSLSETRGCATYMRWMGTPRQAIVSGNGSFISSIPGSIDGKPVSGIVNPFGALGANLSSDLAFLKAVTTRASNTWSMNRSQVGHFRSLISTSNSAPGTPVHSFSQMLGVKPPWRIIPLYLASEEDISAKCDLLGYDEPLKSTWILPLLSSDALSQAINNLGVNRGVPGGAGEARLLYSKLFFRDPTLAQPSGKIPDFQATWSWAPDPTQIMDNDYLIAVRTSDSNFGMYWITQNTSVAGPQYITSTDEGPLCMTITQAPARGMALSGQTPYYFLRGWGGSSDTSGSAAIDDMYINQSSPDTTISTEYSDAYNSPVVISRDSSSLRPKILHRITV